MHRIIKFNQNAWLNAYIDMNTDLIKKAKDQTFSWWIMPFLEKLWKMPENTEILNLSQQKDEGFI